MLIDPPPDTSGRSTFRPMIQNKYSRLPRTGNGYIPCRGYQPCQVFSMIKARPGTIHAVDTSRPGTFLAVAMDTNTARYR